MRKCECCGKEFEPKQKRSKYCSRECQIRGFQQSRPKGVTKDCQWCGMDFYTEHRGTKYCSPACRQRASYEQQRKIVEEKKPKREPKACLHCGKEFIPRDERQKYCASECANVHYRITHKEEIKKKKRKPRQAYYYKKTDGLVAAKPKPVEKPSPASQRWAKMSWLDLTKELLYYGLRYPEAQLMAKNNTLPEDFGLKRKRAR